MEANNYTGFVLIRREVDEVSSDVSNVVGKPRVTWHTLTPMVIYPTIQELIDATPGFDKRVHFIGEVIVHLLSERSEIISVGGK